MYNVIRMIPQNERKDSWIERNVRRGGFKTQVTAMAALRRETYGYMRHYESGTIVCAVVRGKIIEP